MTLQSLVNVTQLSLLSSPINPNVQTTLLSPISPVSSPETVDVLQSAERLVKNAQKQIMEVSFNTALNTLDEYPSNYTGHQPLDERLLYVREIVDSKFQECNDPNGVCIRRAFSNRKLRDDQHPVKDSNGTLNKPLEISARGTLPQNEKPFFKKATNWIGIEPPTKINLFPTTTVSDMRSRDKVSSKVSNCTTKNTGVIEINETNHPMGSIQVQMGPTVDIRSGLTIQTIENVHISPDPFAVPLRSNIASYCFQHETSPSSNSVDLKKIHGDRRTSTGSSASRNRSDSRNERHIQSTDYNDIHKVVHVESTNCQIDTDVVGDSINPSHDTNRSNHSNRKSNNHPPNRIEGESIANSHKLSIDNENLQRKEVTEGNSHSSKDAESEVKNESSERNCFSKIRGDDGARLCSRKCERDVEHGGNEKFKAALEKIADIGKLRFDLRDTGIVPAEGSQISEPEYFRTALENLCKSSQNKACFVGTDSEVFQGAINDFVKIFFDPNSQSSPQNLGSKDIVSTENKVPTKPDGTVDKVEGETKRKEAAKISKQIKIISEQKQMEYQQRSRNVFGSKIDSSAVNDLSSATRYPLASSLAWQSRTAHPKESDNYSKPLMSQRTQLSEGKGICAKEEKTRLDNLDLKEPCVLDVDKVLKVYQDSMSAICLGTEQLSQLISHHIMKNVMATANKISSTIPNSTITDAEPRGARNETTPLEPESNLFPFGLSKISQRAGSIRQDNFTEPNPIRTIISDQIQAARVQTSTFEKISIPQREDHQRATKDVAAFSNEDNSVCANEFSSTCSRSISGQERTLSNSNEKSSSVQSTVDKDTSGSTVASKEFKQSPSNVRNQAASTEHGAANSVHKPERNEFPNIQYCVAEQLGENVPIVVISDEKNSTPLSDSKNPLSAYLDFEYTCAKDVRTRRRSSYDIHSDQMEKFNLHKCPVLISGRRDNLNESSDCNDTSTEGDNVVQKREIELKIFGQILDAVKNSPQIMKRTIISLFNGMEIDSVNDVVTNLKDAEVHPIIIEQFLLILKERNFKSENLSKNKDNMNTFENSTGFNGSMETTNIHIAKEDENPWVRQTAESQVPKTPDVEDLGINLNSNLNKDYNLNSRRDEVLKNKLPSEPIESIETSEKYITEEYLKNNSDNSVISQLTSERKSDIENEASEKSQQDCQGVREMETCESKIAALVERSNTNGLKDSISTNTASKNNHSESNTDKDISFQIPHDADANDEVVDLSIALKSSETLKNGTAEFIVLGTKRSGQNSLKFNSLTHDKSQKINSNSLAGRSSPATDNGKLKSFHNSAPDNSTSTKNLQTDDINAVCNCRLLTNIDNPNTKPPHIPNPSVNEVNALIDSHIQKDYKRLGLLDPDEYTASTSMPIGRSEPSKFGAATKSYVRKAAEPGKSSARKKKPLNSKANEVGKSPRDNKQGSARGVRNVEGNDSEKSGAKHFCALCMQRRGKCSCLNCTSCLKLPKGSVKPKTERPKPIRNTSTPRQGRSPKRPGYLAGKSPSRKESRPTSKEVSSRSTVEPLGCNSKDCSDLITKKRKGTDTETQITAPDFDNLRVEDKSQNTTKAADINVDKSTKMTGTVSESLETFCDRVKLLDVACSIAPKKFDAVAQVDKPQVKDAGTLIYIDNRSPSRDLCTNLRNKCTDRMTTTKERITRCTETKDFSNISSQTSDKSNDLHKHQATSTTGIPESETVSVIKSTCPNIFDEDNIVVLQQLNELDHTFFIAKPNSAERRLIREKIHKNCKVEPKEIITDKFSVCELEQPDNLQTSRDAIQLNSETSPMSFVESKECQASLPGSIVMGNSSWTEALTPKHETDSKDSFFEYYNKCPNLCSNDEDCLGICPHSPAESDESRYNCEQDCSNKETCDTICAPIPHAGASIETSSVDINGVIEKLKKFIAENNVPTIKLRIVQDLLRELKNIEYPMNAEKIKLGTIYERSESERDREIKNSIDTIKPKSEVEDSLRRSVQYNEPYEKVERMMTNKKSLILHNIVRSVADMHPSKNIDRLKIHSREPVVRGSFNKSEADRRYSFFNRMEPERSSIDANDPRSISNKHAAQLNESRRGMDADTHLSDQSNKPSVRPDIDSTKSVESSDLEPGEFSQGQKPSDDPTKRRRNIGKPLQDESRCERFYNHDENYPHSPKNTSKTINIDDEYKVCRHSDETILTRKKNIGDSEKSPRNKAETIDSKLKKEDSTPDNPERISTSNDAYLGSNPINVTEKNSHGISNGNHESKNPEEHFKGFVNRSGCNRPHIIDHFLGKRKLEDMEIQYSDDKTERISKGYPRLGGGAYCQQLCIESDNIAESVAATRKRNDDKDWRNYNEASIRRWDHSSSDTYSEGEVNLPSSCSYSVGEIKLSTPSSTTTGISVKDPDGFTIFVTRSILDSIHDKCTSPGEILAEIRKTSTDSSSSSS